LTRDGKIVIDNYAAMLKEEIDINYGKNSIRVLGISIFKFLLYLKKNIIVFNPTIFIKVLVCY